MEDLIPMVLFVGLFSMIIGIRYYVNKEKMAMIERGMDPNYGKSAPKPFLSLKFGLLLVGLGLGLILGLLTVRNLYGVHPHVELQGQVIAVYFAFLGICGGLGLVISYFVEKKWLDKK